MRPVYEKEPYVFVIDEFADMKDTVGSDVGYQLDKKLVLQVTSVIYLTTSVDVISSITAIPSRVGMRTTNAANSKYHHPTRRM